MFVSVFNNCEVKIIMMNNHRKTCAIIVKAVRNYSIKIKPRVEVNQDVFKDIDSGVYKPRKHPGICKLNAVTLPNNIVEAVEKALSDFPVKQILNDSKALERYLKGRHPPVEKSTYLNKKSEAQSKILSQHPDFDRLSEEAKHTVAEKFEGKITNFLKTQIYAWKPIDYNVHKSLEYLLGRSAAEYAVLSKIFQEIQIRDEHFKPRSFFDFGSGVGSGSWVARQYWKKHIFEYFNVDSAVHMNDLAMILLKGGTGTSDDQELKGVFYRQFLPALNVSYDIVLSAYTLLELPSAQTRLETVLKLWNKTKHYLVLVEHGTNAGFKMINEARDFILQIKQETNKGHVFSPCPHDQPCPRFLMNDVLPCNFETSYMTIPVGQNSELKKERYSYVVLRKGDNTRNEKDLWPRIVRPTLVRSKHAICRMCTSEGHLQEIIFTASKHGKVTYRCAKATKWGDLLPITISQLNTEESKE